MKLQNIQKNWEGLAETDPMWSILTQKEMVNRQWDTVDFFSTGEVEVNNWFSHFEELKHLNSGRALDFGCGMGRITQGLCAHFDYVLGVDISGTMVDLANENNIFSEKCFYMHNDQPNLKDLESDSFDFISSYITLQHLPKEYIFSYIEEFLRVLKPGGVILFSLPTRPPFLYRFLIRIFTQSFVNNLRRLRYKMKYVMEMHWVSEAEMKNFIECRGKLINMYPNSAVGEDWQEYLFLVSK